MGTTISTLERKIGATARSAQRCIQKYSEDASQRTSRFGAKSFAGKGKLCRVLQEGGV